MRRSGARSGRLSRHQALVALLVLLSLAVVLGGCAGRRGLGASQSWSGVAVQEGTDSAFVGTRDGRILEIVLTTDSSGRVRPALGEEFDANSRQDESEGSRVDPAFYGTPVISGGRIYAASYQGFVYSLRASGSAEGAPLGDVGSFEIDGDSLTKGITGSLVVADGAVVTAASESSKDGRLYVLEAAELDDNSRPLDVERCRYPDRDVDPVGPIWSTPAVHDGIAYFGDLFHFVHAVSLATCELVWDKPTELDGAIVATPLIVGDRMYLGSFDGSFYAIDLADGAVTELFSSENWFWAGAATDGNQIYVPNLDGLLYAYDIERGMVAWTYDQEGGREKIISMPVVVDDKIVMASDSGILTLLNSRGERLRRLGRPNDEVRAPLTVSGDTVIAHSVDEFITALKVERDDLDSDWEFQLTGF